MYNRRSTDPVPVFSLTCVPDVVIMSPQASQVHAWQSAVNTVNLTTSGMKEKEAIVTSAEAEKVTIIISFYV